MRTKIAVPAALLVGALLLSQGPACGQDRIRSVVVSVDAGGRLSPTRPGTSPAGSKRYWADSYANAIRRSDLDGSRAEDVVRDLKTPYGLSYDTAAGAFLWTSAAEEVVQKVPAAGGDPVSLKTEFEEPYSIVVVGEGWKTGYAVVEGEVVKITQYDTSEAEEREVLLRFDPAFETVHGLALDESAGTLYVGNGEGQMTRRVRLADRQVENLVFVEDSFPTELGPVKGVK